MQDKIIQLRKGKKGRLKPGHPWIFKGQILKLTSSVRPGDIVTVISSEDDFIGRGYYNPASDISIRLLTFNEEPVDSALIHRKIKEAVEKREFLKEITNAKRLVFSEADAIPGLIVDLYNDTLVIQIYTLGMEKLREEALSALKDVVGPKYIYEKSDSPFRRIEKLKSVKCWVGTPGPAEVEIDEAKVKFIVDIEKGHKTGFYLDQRRSRLALRAIAKGKKVLDLFCYTGGFSINAALGGAKKVLGIDVKSDWLDLARRNAALNNVSGAIDLQASDAFNAIKNICNSGEKFDIIVVDPPSFLRSKKDLITAAKGYKEINTLAFKSLADDGVLCTFSCSHNMPNKMFSDIVKDAAACGGKKFVILKRCRQDKDHPISREIPETEYLKGYFLKTVQ
ncbi:MAG: class I SAM-dependent rRNA methyltransferase [Candidatus Omnitrophota bacterium]|nr:class I SAM-dependent rRNA methyltransferase [Candidatus Omnitrophota bacterium]